jgi:hypothetical protein
MTVSRSSRDEGPWTALGRWVGRGIHTLPEDIMLIVKQVPCYLHAGLLPEEAAIAAAAAATAGQVWFDEAEAAPAAEGVAGAKAP